MSNLVVVVNAAKDITAKLEEEKKSKTEEYNNLITSLETEYKQTTEELKKQYETEANNLKITHDRENEEYNYKQKRDREIINNKWEDEKNTREKVLSQKEEETNKALEEAKINLECTKELEKKVDEIPELIAKEYERGKKEKEDELTKDHKFEIELLKKDFQNTIDRQSDKIESLNEEIKKVTDNNKLLQNKLDKAYNQIKDMATKTVEATGGVKILGNNQQEKI